MYAEIMTANGFNSPWYWLLVAIIWARSIQLTIGIPNDVMRDAVKGDEQAKQDALALLDMHIRTVIRDFDQMGTFLVLMVSFVLASFATMGFWNDIAVLQGVFFIAMPMAILGAIGVRLAYKLQSSPPDWDTIRAIYRKHRWIKSALAVVFIFATMLWSLFLEIRPYLDQL